MKNKNSWITAFGKSSYLKILVLSNFAIGCASADWSIPGTRHHAELLDQSVSQNSEQRRMEVSRKLQNMKGTSLHKKLEKAYSDDTLIIEVSPDGKTLIGR